MIDVSSLDQISGDLEVNNLEEPAAPVLPAPEVELTETPDEPAAEAAEEEPAAEEAAAEEAAAEEVADAAEAAAEEAAAEVIEEQE